MESQQDDTPLKVLLEHLKWHLQRMAEVQEQEATAYFRDAALQRFEFTLGSVLKCIRKAASDSGNVLSSDEATLEYARQANWFADNINCPDILASLHLLKPGTRDQNADAVYSKLNDYHAQFATLHLNLRKLA